MLDHCPTFSWADRDRETRDRQRNRDRETEARSLSNVLVGRFDRLIIIPALLREWSAVHKAVTWVLRFVLVLVFLFSVRVWAYSPYGVLTVVGNSNMCSKSVLIITDWAE